MNKKPTLFLAVLLLLLAVSLVWLRPADESPSALQPNQSELADSPEHTVKTVAVTDISSGVAENSNPASEKKVRPEVAVGAEVVDRQAVADSLAITNPRALRPFGKGAPFVIKDLPDGILKTQLLALNAEPQAKALKWLHSFTFNGVDAVESLRADSAGGIFYKCAGLGCDGCADSSHHSHVSSVSGSLDDGSASSAPEVDAIEEPTTTEPPVTANAAGDVNIDSPPAYNSKPGASKHIYLDFNGASVSGKSWSETDGVTTWTSWVCAAWSTDADTSTFSDSEQTIMRQVWERISEDYAPFDVNVTTDVAYDTVNYKGDKNKVGWLLFTDTTDTLGARCPHYGSGGVAYVGVYGNSNYFSSYQPAWVKSTSVANMAEAASHEMGHNMGLSHDTRSNESYYGGHGSNDISWGPIMGTGYGRNVSQWSKGEYYDSKHASYNGSTYVNNPNTNDDLAIISARVSYQADDHGNTNGSATALTSAGDGSFSDTGIVQETGETDVFSFQTGTGLVTLNATPYIAGSSTKGGNLDILMELYDSGGSLVTSNNGATVTTATISTTLAAGTYYVHIKPTSAGNATGTGSPYDSVNSTRVGYTVYGSLGQYTLSGNLVLPGVSITESGGTNVTEGGATDTYSISLGTAPSSNVTVNITPNAQITTDKSSVVFTPGNWSSAQIVTVTAVDDALEEGPHTGTITHTSSSSDSAFNGIGVGSVTVNITDNDNILIISPNGGEVWYTGSVQNISWASEIGGNVKIELYKNGVLQSPAISTGTPNSGSYPWNIPTNQALGSDYKIKITSLEPAAKSDISVDYFSILSVPTLADALDTSGVTWTSSGNMDWDYQTTTTHDGVDAAQSGAITHSQTSSMQANFTGPGNLTFWWKVSSENNYDWMSLYVDDVIQTGSLAKISGTVDWVQKTVSIPSGTHTVKWTYAKDGSISSGSDKAWVDQVVFTPASTTLDHFVISPIASPQIVGQPITGITLTAKTNSGVTVASFTGTVTYGGTAGITGTSANFVGGVLSGVSRTPTSVGTNRTLTVTSDAATGSATFSVGSANAPIANAGSDDSTYLTGSTWSPIELAPKLWLDADDSDTITLNGSSVSQWNDKSGFNRHATATSTSQPVATDNGLNGKRVITFDGSNDFFAVDLDFLAGVSHSTFIVTKPTIYSNIYGAATGGLSLNSLHVGFSNGTKYRMNFWGNDFGPTMTPKFQAGSANILNFVWNAGVGKEIFANGSSEASNTNAGTIGTMSGGGRIGHTTAGNHSAFGGDIAEFIAVTGTMSLANRQSLEGYLAHKWGTTGLLDAAHPYKSTSPSNALASVSLTGIATDADSGDTLTVTWSKVSGPGNVTFGSPTSVNSTASFSVAGTYVLRLTVSDGVRVTTDDIQIVINPPNPYMTWSGSSGTSSDDNGDGIPNGIAWVIGATDVSTNAIPLLPVLDNTTDASNFIFTYRRSDIANANADKICVEYSSDLVTWTEALDSSPDIIITEFNDDYGAGVDKVEVKIKRTVAVGEKLFSRLNVVITP